MPAPATRYDAQLIERFGSIDTFRARRRSPDPAVWGPALDHMRITETEKELGQLLSRVCALTATGTHPDTELVARLDAVLNDMYELIDIREDAAFALETHLGLTTPEPEPAEVFDPHAHLTPALGTTRAPAKGRPPSPSGTGPLTPNFRTALTAFDARVEALVRDPDRLREPTDRTQADPGLVKLVLRHDALTAAETACLFYRVRIHSLSDGRWYADSPLVHTIDQAITHLETHVTARDGHARDLDRHLARLEAEAARDPASAAGPVPDASPTDVPAVPGDRSAAALAVSPAAQHHGGTATATQAVRPAPPSATARPTRHR